MPSESVNETRQEREGTDSSIGEYTANLRAIPTADESSRNNRSSLHRPTTACASAGNR